VSHQYVLVRDRGKICGIVTRTDLSIELKCRSETFLLINHIENHIRNLILRYFTTDEVCSYFNSDEMGINIGKRNINSVFDLTFNQYTMFLQTEENWKRLGLTYDKKTVIDEIESTGHIRNEVMHFRPGPSLKPESLEGLLRLLEL